MNGTQRPELRAPQIPALPAPAIGFEVSRTNSRSDGVKSGNGYSQRVPAAPERRNGCQPSPKDHAGRLGGSPRQLNVFACKPASIGAFTPPPLSSSSSSPEPPGRPDHPPVPPSPTQMDLAGPSCPLWSLWPASARSSAHRSTRAGHHEHVVRLQRAGWGGGAGSSSRGHRPRARATTSRPLRWTGPSRLQPAQILRRGPFSSRFVPSSACPTSVGTHCARISRPVLTASRRSSAFVHVGR